MRQTLFFMPVLTFSLAACASGPNIAMCVRGQDSELRPELATNKSIFHLTKPRPKLVAAAVAPGPMVAEASEPRQNSTEWWLRENIRLNKAMVICRGCLPSIAANVSLPRQPALSAISPKEALQ
jgi:hypothetical protein